MGHYFKSLCTSLLGLSSPDHPHPLPVSGGRGGTGTRRAAGTAGQRGGNQAACV